jgi:hypothetical protein
MNEANFGLKLTLIRPISELRQGTRQLFALPFAHEGAALANRAVHTSFSFPLRKVSSGRTA